MELNSLTAVSPIDGRYGSKTADLRPVFSEYGLIRQRVTVEIRWLQSLAAHPAITEVPSFSQTTLQQLEQIVAGFSESDAQRVKQIERTPNIEVHTRTSVVEAHGDKQLQAITIRDNDTDETRRVETPARFIFIGAVPHTELVASIVQRNRAGFILTGADLLRDGRKPAGWPLRRDPYLLETSVPGIFAAGDVRQGAVRRVASAVGQGANAINFVHQYLRTV